jgi:ankyrin repeat protein
MIKMKRVIVLLQLVFLVCSVSAVPTIHKSARAGNLLEVKQFIDSGIDVDALDSNGHTPMSRAIEGDSPEYNRDYSNLVQLLIDEGANVNLKLYGKNSTYLHEAVDSTKVMEILINNGADINAQDNYLVRPLDNAIAGDRSESVMFLRDKGADVGGPPKLKVEQAIKNGNFEVVKEHLRLGLDPKTKDETGKSFLHITAIFGPTHFPWKGRIPKVAQLLIDEGVDVNGKDNSGDAPLHKAAIYNRGDVAQVLFNNGADLQSKDKKGRTPLEVATFYQVTEMVDLLKKLEKEKPKEIIPAELTPYRGHLAFEITIDKAAIGKPHRVEYSTDNKTWQILELITLEKESNVYLDKSGVGQPKRFYRVKSEG